MNFSSPGMIFLAEHNFFEINYQKNCIEPTKKCLFFNFEALSWSAWASRPGGIPNFFYLHIDMLLDHSDNKISLVGYPNCVVFLCHGMLKPVGPSRGVYVCTTRSLILIHNLV